MRKTAAITSMRKGREGRRMTQKANKRNYCLVAKFQMLISTGQKREDEFHHDHGIMHALLTIQTLELHRKTVPT